ASTAGTGAVSSTTCSTGASVSPPPLGHSTNSSTNAATAPNPSQSFFDDPPPSTGAAAVTAASPRSRPSISPKLQTSAASPDRPFRAIIANGSGNRPPPSINSASRP